VILYGEAEGVKAVLQDNGLAFDPFSLDAPDTDLDLDSRAIGGLGVHLVRQMTESQHYEREGDRNRVTLFKRHEA
jgi:serine/threonine-protein kinase RsbW